ncbi:winged helix DNA-binding domain-containing protein [Arthrobacter sp. Helios]|uniref:winged helix DNA-binding domain-containing protein n=1 Tax=Arthrobacter sp. Helios TaxID=2828862 RepID=UPI00205B74C6|nr:winged helix DNA-binding domain-containing protein [Arthrobacter sp. Helios]UPO78117.1 winged helix DNA-binding domain-containing protein [Arthrobacter sp. Helios]
MDRIRRTEVLARRLRSHGLTTSVSIEGGTPGAVDRLFALQGQDLPGALWSLGLRSGSTLAEVTAAFDDGTLVRSWPFRGTLHVLRGEDVHWTLALTSERILRSAVRRREELELDAETLEKTTAVAVGALTGGGRLSRRELLELFETAGIRTSGQRGYHLLWHLSVTGTTVLGPMQGSEQLFVLLDEWVPQPRRLDRTASLAELVRRYLAGRAPATTADIAWWAKLPLADVRAGLAEAAADLEEVEYDGAPHWRLSGGAADAAGPAARTRSVVLLPGFDEYLLGYTDRSAALAAEHAQLTVPGGNGIFKPTLVLDGRIAGLWSRKSSAKKTVLTVRPFAPIPQRALPGLRRAAKEYGRFLGVPAEVDPF